MSDIRGELRNASDAPPISPMPCFSGFGLPVCTQYAVDTEGYSNTGFQLSKASPKGAAMKMAAGGNQAKKKDLGAIAMMHETVC